MDIDEVASSLLRYTNYSAQEYFSVNEVLRLQINRGADLSGEGASYAEGGSSITVSSSSDSETGAVSGISFMAYTTVGCILAEKDDW